MKIKPMLGGYEVPGIQRIGAIERRRVVEIPVPGLSGSYHQDLGASAASIRIEGTLSGDDSREGFLTEVRDKFSTGDPVDFVADITTATEIDQVIISDLKVQEVAGAPDSFRYALTITQHTEPPPPPAAGADLGFGDLTGLDLSLDLEAVSLLDLMQIPDLLGSVPDFKDPTPPLRGTLDGVKTAMEGLGGITTSLADLFGEGS